MGKMGTSETQEGLPTDSLRFLLKESPSSSVPILFIF